MLLENRSLLEHIYSGKQVLFVTSENGSPPPIEKRTHLCTQFRCAVFVFRPARDLQIITLRVRDRSVVAARLFITTSKALEGRSATFRFQDLVFPLFISFFFQNFS